MFEKIKQIFGMRSKVDDETYDDLIEDPDFGLIGFFDPEINGVSGIWQTETKWDMPEYNANFGFSAIPGDKNGPFEYSRKFFIEIKSRLNDVWNICDHSLRMEMARWYADKQGNSPKDIFFLSSISLENESGEWVASFESREGINWTFVSCRIANDQVMSTTVDT